MPPLLSADATALDVGVACVMGAVLLRWAVALVLAASDWLRQRQSAPDPLDVEPLTVIVPAWNEATVIERTVRSLLASDLPDLAVVVVDDGSTDATAAIVRDLVEHEPRLTLVQQPRNAGKAEALNAGLRVADTALVVTVDADTLVERQCLRWLVATQRQTGADAVAANVRVGNRRLAPLARWQSLEYVAGLNLDRRALHRLSLITTVPGAAALWRRETVLSAGGFSSDTLAEDTDLSVTLLRSGGLLAFQDRAHAYTEAPVMPYALWRQRRRWLTGNLGCIRKHGLGAGAGLGVRLVALPNLWFAHIGVYLVPVVVWAWVTFGRGAEELQLLGTLAAVGLALDLTGILGSYLADRADPWDLLQLPLQRLLYPTFLWGVFASVVTLRPRAWASIERRGTALIGTRRPRGGG
ncbi:MAG: glycosyltransferase family 2 protein [Myxococcales bacterium]|nr:glycosyltransferase family 2 protein [Myxococcales bacterium]